MKTRLLRKLRREAKRYVKIVNELEYGRYAIILKYKKQKSSYFPISGSLTIRRIYISKITPL